MAPILSGGLPNMGIFWNMARSLVYAPLKNQGLGINELDTTQERVHVKEVLNHIWRGAEADTLLKTSIECENWR